MPTCVLVLGTPRSGTSYVSGILHQLGVVMFPPLHSGEPSEANPKGFFNDTEFESFCNIKYGTYFPTKSESLTLAESEQLRRIILDRQSSDETWGVKEWRIATFLSDFIEFASDVRIIKLSRAPLRSMNSWNEHFTRLQTITIGDVQRAQGLINSALAQVQLPLLEVDFDEAIDNKVLAVKAIADFVGKPINKQALDMIDASLRRF